MKASTKIPIHTLQERNKDGIEIQKFDYQDKIYLKKPHRDDHYIFFFHESGYSKLFVDFNEVTIDGCAIMVVLPGQVHYGLYTLNSKALFIALDSSRINELLKPVLQQGAQNSPLYITPEQASILRETILLMENVLKNLSDTHFYSYTLRSITDSCLSTFASYFHQQQQQEEKPNLRISVITRQFKSMLLSSFKKIKSPSEYASCLNISASYLNEAVKETTGHPVSYWIHQEIILEAKRMLFYTDFTVKEIANELGYEDPTYFIRLFSKITKMPPLQFRKTHRK